MLTNYDKTGLVAVGANLPSGGNPPETNVSAAMDELAKLTGGSVRKSRLFHTPAFPEGSGPQYVNATMTVEWSGNAHDLLDLLHEVEERFGRTRTNRWEARVMDLDLIGLGSRILPDERTQTRWANLQPQVAARNVPSELVLPHPRLSERPFVLVPLHDVAPDWTHPVSNMSVAELLERCDPEALLMVQPVGLARATGT